jgi:hypothetical protein
MVNTEKLLDFGFTGIYHGEIITIHPWFELTRSVLRGSVVCP